MSLPRLLLRALLPVLLCFASEGAADTAESSAIPADPQKRSAYFRRIYDEGNTLFHGKHDIAGGLVHYERLEREARAAGDIPWLRNGIWKIAQVRASSGRLEESAALFEAAREIVFAEEGSPTSANHFLVLGNLCGHYRSLGRMGAFAIRHAEGVGLARLYFTRQTGADPLSDPFTHDDETMLRLDNTGFIGQIFFEEAWLRFESGREREAIELAERLERRLGATPPKNHWERDLIAETRQHLAAWCDEIGRDAERDHWEARLLVAEGEPGHGSRSWHLGRLRQADRRHRQGDDRPARRAEIEASLERLRVINRPDEALREQATLARVLAREGDFADALALLDKTLSELTTLQLPATRARLLLARAELRLAAGVGADTATASDLRDALAWLRTAGHLREEPEAYLLYARHLRASGDFAGARTVLADAQFRLARFIFPELLSRLHAELRALASAPDSTAPRTPLEPGDLQPVEIVTRLRKGEPVGARFFVTNPDRNPVSGTLRILGPVGDAHWDAQTLVWRVRMANTGPAREILQPVRLDSLDQARVVLRHEQAGPDTAPVEIGWTSDGEPQSAWWRFAAETSARPATLRGDNLALGNPFYAVPLHHALTDAVRAAPGTLNMRVLVEPPCRVELVDDGTGEVLAVDAQGDGDFRLAGDVLWRDLDHDGYPDLTPSASEASGIELYLYPTHADVDHLVRLETRGADGVWTPQTTDTLFGTARR